MQEAVNMIIPHKIKILISISFINFLYSNYYENLFSLENKFEYRLIEFSLLESNHRDVFILNQPYSNELALKLVEKSSIKVDRILDRFRYTKKNKRNFRFSSKVGINNPKYDPYTNYKTYLKLVALFDFDNVLLFSSVDFDKTLKDDNLFHGDKNEWATVFIKDAYAVYRKKGIEVFGGRVSRNFGVLNDFSSILSNYSYPFDHFGFSLTKSNLKFSFYTARLNNIREGIDLQGVVIENDFTTDGDTLLNVMDTKRYFAIQRLDFKLSDNVQAALSASTVYGGPNQSFESEYLNPLNIFYASQRNSKIQMNNLYQLNLLFKNNLGSALYMDFLIDDVIVNNEEGYKGSDYKDNRFALIVKFSKTNLFFDKNLFFISYARIWNETYLSYRNFENYIFFNKSIGYPFNSYQSIKFSFTNFSFKDFFNSIAISIYQKGSNQISSTEFFNESIQDFPSGEVIEGTKVEIDMRYAGPNNVDVFYTYSLDSIDDMNNLSTHKFKLVYNFQF